MRRVNLRLIRQWLPEPGPRALKSDLFEEAVSSEGLLTDLGPSSIGLDGSFAIAAAARQSVAGSGHVVVGDLRAIPLRSHVVSSLFSGSSLDHFAEKPDLARSLAELARILADGAPAIVPLDNPPNPVGALRNGLPFAALHRLGLVPYYVGQTYRHREAVDACKAAGFAVTGSRVVAHAPRLVAIWAITLCERRRAMRLAATIGRALDAFELLERLPTRRLTGYYLAYQLQKRSRVD
jgi:hypothetical protein